MKNILFLLITLTSCASPDLLISTTSQQWTGGLKGSKSGTNYKFIMIAPESEEFFSIKDICVNEKLYLGHINMSEFNKGDTILISSRKTTETCSNQNTITYLINKEQKSIVIDSIEILEKLFYP